MVLGASLVALAMLCGCQKTEGLESGTGLGDQLVVWATVLGTVAAMPALDDSFGIKLVLPGTDWGDTSGHPRAIPELHPILSASAELYLREAQQAGFVLKDLTVQSCTERMLQVASNPAEIRDMVSLFQTTAIYRRKTQPSTAPTVTPDILELAISRVIVGAGASAHVRSSELKACLGR